MARSLEERFGAIRIAASIGALTPDAQKELLAIATELVAERRRVRLILARLPDDFGRVRQHLNELSRALR